MSLRSAALSVSLVLAALAGCGGGDDPAPADAGDGLPACSLGPTMADVEEKVFRGPKCIVCHGRVTLYPTTLDLMSDGVADRMLDRPGESDPVKGKCAGRVIVPRADPWTGLLVEKVEKAQPSCGDRMPPPGFPALTGDEIACIKRWARLAATAQGR